MEKRRISNTFSKYRGSVQWAANRLNVGKSTVSRWLSGDKTSARLDREMPALATELRGTDGLCIFLDARRASRKNRRKGNHGTEKE